MANIRNTKYFDGITAHDVKAKIGCCTATAQGRVNLYRKGEITYDEMIRPLGRRNKYLVELPNGDFLSSKGISDIRGCNQNHARACMRQHEKGEITLEQLLSPVKKKHRYTHHRMTGGTKTRDYNLKKIPEPSVWERENM